MRRKVTLVLLVLFVLSAGTAFANELELGISVTPLQTQTFEGEDTVEAMPGFHVARKFFGILYGSWDAIVAGPGIMEDLTTFYRPGYINVFGAGFRLDIASLRLTGTIGVNSLYLYRQDEDRLDFDADFGANLRLGAAWQFNRSLGVGVSGMTLFPSFASLVNTLEALGADSTRDDAVARIRAGLIPSIHLNWYI